jgi:hypothetical protein
VKIGDQELKDKKVALARCFLSEVDRVRSEQCPTPHDKVLNLFNLIYTFLKDSSQLTQQYGQTRGDLEGKLSIAYQLVLMRVRHTEEYDEHMQDASANISKFLKQMKKSPNSPCSDNQHQL